ncbi:MAG: hypothetical protein WC729_05080 [Sphingomonas sp.]|uniref:hypothetical protein n=1 Tax=Sphingomonas sp. TaxID=28214 RepID=UPI0035645FF3
MIYEPEFADQARTMCRLGATDEELAEHFGACVRTIYRWRNTHEAFAEAVVAGKKHADARVERALYSRAIGCTVERTKVFKSAGEDPVYATYQHHLPPDTTAALNWLRVRQPKKWRMAEKEEEMSESRKALTEFVRRCEARDEEKRLARQREQQPSTPPPPPPLEPVALAPDPAPQPCPCPDEDPHPAPATKPAPPPPPAPKTVMRPCDFPISNRGPGGYGWQPPDPGG